MIFLVVFLLELNEYVTLRLFAQLPSPAFVSFYCGNGCVPTLPYSIALLPFLCEIHSCHGNMWALLMGKAFNQPKTMAHPTHAE